MSYIVVWGYKTGLSNKKFLGIKPCSNCGKFSEHYLAKSFFRINLFWFIPIFGVPTGKYLRCGNCDGVRKLTRAEWKELKESVRYMPKKKDYLKAYEELKALVIASEPDDLTTDIIYNRLLGKLDFTDEGGHIRELVDVYLKNSRNAAAIAAKNDAPAVQSAAPAEGETPTLTAETGVTRELPAADTTAAVQTAAPTYAATADTTAAPTYAAAAETAVPKKASKWRLLWLIPAILLLPVALFLLAAVIMTLTDPTVDIVSMVIIAVLFGVIPIGLDVLFFVLALKKKKQ